MSTSLSFQTSWPARRPVFTTSAMPARRSFSGSVARTLGLMPTDSGKWNAPARFFPSGVLIPVLPPIAASTWPVSVVGTAIQRIPRR